MKIHSARFEVSAPSLESCPTRPLPEFAFIGRSNVGKSSLINLLAERSGLAKVSDTPGKTQLINFFIVNGNWGLVDLPGYGYAAVSKERRLGFNDAVADFIAGRPNLRCVFVLIDSRLSPQPIDIQFLRWLEDEAVRYALVFTKVDKQAASKAQTAVDAFKRIVGEWRTELPATFTSSVKSREGRSEILGFIKNVLEQDKKE
jgi:GTP-binding protein